MHPDRTRGGSSKDVAGGFHRRGEGHVDLDPVARMPGPGSGLQPTTQPPLRFPGRSRQGWIPGGRDHKLRQDPSHFRNIEANRLRRRAGGGT